jgi:mycofactocin biosynthesis protein MftB
VPIVPAGEATEDFDPTAAWRLSPQVSVRPESFGALVYHFGTRRLSFLKNTTIVGVVTSLGDHPSARHACTAAGVEAGELGVYEQALAGLARSGTIVPSEPTP